MPYKSRTEYLRYLRDWKLVNRPSPKPIANNVDPALPPRGKVVFSRNGRKVQCHSCGRWFGSLNTHLRMHGLDAASYKELYHLKRTASLWPPTLQGKQRDAAIERKQGDVGRDHLPHDKTGRPKGLTNRLQTKIEASKSRKGRRST